MKKVHFSVVTVVKNDLAGLMRSRESLEMQKYLVWTHIIIDGGSTDNTISYLRKLPKENTVFISEPDHGIYDAMNKGWRLSKEDSFVFFLNARDVMTDSNSLVNASAAIKANVGSNWGCTTHEEIDQDGTGWVCKLVSPPTISNQLYAFGYRSHQAVVMRKAFIEKLGGFNENFKIAADWELIVKALEIEEPVVWNQPIARFELGGMSSGRMLEAHSELRQLRETYLKMGFYRRIVDDLWCAIFLNMFGYRNYWTNLFRFLFYRNQNFSLKVKKRSRRPITINFFYIQLSIKVVSKRNQKLGRKKRRLKLLNVTQAAFLGKIRKLLGILDYS